MTNFQTCKVLHIHCKQVAYDGTVLSLHSPLSAYYSTLSHFTTALYSPSLYSVSCDCTRTSRHCTSHSTPEQAGWLAGWRPLGVIHHGRVRFRSVKIRRVSRCRCSMTFFPGKGGLSQQTPWERGGFPSNNLQRGEIPGQSLDNRLV